MRYKVNQLETNAMRILLINDYHAPKGGAEKYFFDLKQRLQQLPGYIVYSVGFGDEEKSGDDFAIFKAPRSNLAKFIWRILFHPRIHAKLRKCIETFKPDIIHLHNIKFYTPTILAAVKSFPTVQTVHDFGYICPVSQNIHKDLKVCKTGMQLKCFWQHQVKFNLPTYTLLALSLFQLRRKIKKSIDHFVAPSPILVDYLKSHQFTSSTYVPLFMQHKTALPTTPSANHFLYAGQLANHKGVHLLIDEFALACQAKPDLQLFLAGAGHEESRLKDKVNALNLNKNIHFIGWQKDLTAYYQSCIALLFPSIGMESFGLVIAEAMSNSRAVIGVNRGTSAWLIEDGKTGLLFDPLKKGDLAEKIVTMIDQTERAKQMGEHAKQRITSLMNHEIAMNNLIELYRSVARTRSSCKRVRATFQQF